MKNKSILREILLESSYFDNIKRTDKEESLLDEAIKCEDEIKKRLAAISPELSALYDKTNDSIERYCCENTNTFYLEGFRLGFLICLEILNP